MAGVSNKVQGQNRLSKNSDLAHWKALENMKYMDFAFELYFLKIYRIFITKQVHDG